MCHIIYAMPVLGLGFFYFLPFEWAVPFYVFVVILSFGLYYLTFDAMRRPVVIGMEAMIGSEGKALSDIDRTGRIRYKNEIWSAESKDKINRDETVKILGYKRGILVVEKTYCPEAEV